MRALPADRLGARAASSEPLSSSAVDVVRELGLERLRRELAIAFGDDPRSPAIDRLARFALATIDGAFVAVQSDTAYTLDEFVQPLPAALVAARRALMAGA
jgi:hypothetical protein